jgi:hypothetical protein
MDKQQPAQSEGAKSEVAGKRFDCAVVVRLTSAESVPGSSGLRNNLDGACSARRRPRREREDTRRAY